MHFGSKGVLSLAFIAAAAMSSASLNYNNIVATVSYNGGPAQNLTVLIDGNSITFNPPPTMIVSNVGPTSAVVNISYDVTSSKGINGLDLIFDGFTDGSGQVNYSEVVKDGGSNVIASTSGTESGNNNTFVKEDFLSFSNGAETAYSVNKEFDLNLGNTPGVLSPGVASLGLVEQNAVPEPVTLGAVGVGLFGLLARKRRK